MPSAKTSRAPMTTRNGASAGMRSLGVAIGPHDAGQRVAVGDADARMAERMGLGHELLRMRGAAQEARNWCVESAKRQFGERCASSACRPGSSAEAAPCRIPARPAGLAVSRPNRPSRNSQKRRPSRSSARK